MIVSRDQGYTRQQRERMIKKRMNILKTWDPSWMPEHVGRLNKWNLTCGCDMCKEGKKSRRPDEESS